jgi:AcrR family transcriptional regulator
LAQRAVTPKPNDLREHIVDAAIKLLRESGVKKLAQPQVARAAGIPQGHLTYYFPKKADLLVAVARRTIQVFARELGAERQATALCRFHMKDVGRTRMLIGLLVAADEEPALREVLVENFGIVRRLVAAGMKRAEDDLDVEIAMATLWGLGMQHFLLHRHRPEEHTDALIERLPEHRMDPPAKPSRRKT